MIGYFDPKDKMARVQLKISGTKKEVKAGLIPGPNEKEALVGLGLFSSYIITIDAANDEFQIKNR